MEGNTWHRFAPVDGIRINPERPYGRSNGDASKPLRPLQAMSQLGTVMEQI